MFIPKKIHKERYTQNKPFFNTKKERIYFIFIMVRTYFVKKKLIVHSIIKNKNKNLYFTENEKKKG
jgi:hypothetical protein